MSSVRAFLHFAFGNIFRNRRRAITAMIGIIFAVTLIAGENIAIDTTATTSLRRTLEEVPVDFWVISTSLDYANVTSTMEKVEDVERVEPIHQIGYVDISANTNVTSYTYLVGVRPSFKEVMDKFDIIGNFTLQSGTVVLSSEVVTEIGADIGDNVSLSTTYQTYENGIRTNYTYSLNLTVTGIVSVKESYSRPHHHWVPFTSKTAFISIHDREYIEEELHMSPSPHEPSDPLQYFIWVNHDKLININDLDGTKELMKQVKRRIELDGAEYGVSIMGSDLEMAINSYSNKIIFYRLSILALSLPVIALGFYLGIIGVELGMNERRREIGILKSRGASDKQIFSMFLFESIILGIIAGVVGLLCGLLSTRAFLGLGGQEVGLFDIAISNISIAISILLAIILMLIAVIRPARRISKVQIVEALHYYSKEEVKKRYKPTMDIMMILIAGFTYFFIVVFEPASFYEDSFTFVTLITIVFFALAPILVPFSPFLLIFGLTRLLTRSTNKIYSTVSHATKFFTKDMWHIMNKNLARNPRRASRVCVIISLALAFGIFTMTFTDTSIAFEERKIKAEIGSDIRITSYIENMSFERKLSAVDGVESVIAATGIDCDVGSDCATALVAFNSSAYHKTINTQGLYFVEGTSDALTALGNGKNAMITKNLADEFGIHAGDTLPVQYYGLFLESISETYRIAAVVKYLPGLLLYTHVVFVDLSSMNFTALPHRSYSFIVKVMENFDHKEVANSIKTQYPDEVSDIKIFEVEKNKIKNDPMFGAFLYFLTVEYAFVLLIATVGIGLIMFVAAREREQEIANIIARGASTKQIFSLFLGEGFTIMLIGILIGSSTGLLTAYAFNEMIAIDPYQLVERTLILSPSLAILIFASIIALMFTIAIVSLKAARIKLHQALRIRGG